LKLLEIKSILRLCDIHGNSDIEVSGIQSDSRQVQAGDLFICVPGLVVDGHDYSEKAVQQGAVALVTERLLLLPGTIPQLLVKDARYAMAVIASHFYGHPSHKMKMIGVTGTNGKTTTTYLIEHLLSSAGFRTGLMGTIHIKIGSQVQDSERTTLEATDLQHALAQMVEQQTDYCLMEVSSHALELGRVIGVHFRSAIFTNLTQDHLDYHQTMDHYKAAKGLLFARLGNGSAPHPAASQFAILNIDDPASVTYRKSTAGQVITYGIEQACDVRAENIRISAKYTHFDLKSFAGDAQITMKLIGKFNVYNALAAIAVTLAEGLSIEQIKDALASASTVRGRMEVATHIQDDFTVIVDYAHTPDGLDNALSTVCEFAQGKVITVFGCGGDRDKTKRPLMAKVTAKYSDYIFITSDNPRTEHPLQILRDVEVGLTEIKFPHENYELIEDRKLAIQKAIDLAGPHDVVLIAGKGHETYQIIHGEKLDSDDLLIAQTYIRSKRS
jgi:UDP-N-acetylmuramoyl-L-alanyl-D-glutamate--2,6-diaminopimelate ligase